MSIALPETEVCYPSSDGEPMAETGIHTIMLMLLHQALSDVLRPTDPDVLLTLDQFWYYQKGDPRQVVAPDIMVVPGAGADPRRSYMSWKEPVPKPALVFEAASEGTYENDLGDKFDLYERLGVPEYFLFDPEDLYLEPPLRGFRLRAGKYRELKLKDGMLESRLGFRMKPQGQMLRLYRLTGEMVLTPYELVEVAAAEKVAADRRANEEASRADAALAEVARLKALLAKATGTP